MRNGRFENHSEFKTHKNPSTRAIPEDNDWEAMPDWYMTRNGRYVRATPRLHALRFKHGLIAYRGEGIPPDVLKAQEATRANQREKLKSQLRVELTENLRAEIEAEIRAEIDAEQGGKTTKKTNKPSKPETAEIPAE